MMFRRPAAIMLAVGLDLALGEPPARWHPVAWLGRAFNWAERRAPGRRVADGAAALPSSPDAIRRARRVLGTAAAITVVFMTGVSLLGRSRR